MIRFLKPAGTALVIGGALVLDMPTAHAQADQFTVTAIKASTAPTIDGNADDAVWGQATATSVKAIKGVNFGGSGETTGTIKAAYVGDMLYILMEWNDPTQSYQRSPYKKQADGSWVKLKDPDDKGGDNNKVYEDKAALIWNVNDSIFGFDRRGCQIACHAASRASPMATNIQKRPASSATSGTSSSCARCRSAKSMTSTSTTPVTTRRRPRKPAARATPTRAAATRTSPSRTESPNS